MAGNPVVQVTSLQRPLSLSDLSALSAQQTTKSCPSVDVEWPPRASFGVNPQFGDTERQTIAAGTSSTSNLENDDPFADWPPRPNGSGISNNGTLGMPLNKIGFNSMTSTSSNMGPQTSNSWPVNSQSSAESISLNSRNASSTMGSLNSGPGPQNSLGFLKQSHAFPASNVSYNNVQSTATDLGSIFSSNKNEQIAPKLAPPPSTAVGRGRGRGRGSASSTRSSHTKSRAEQPPLLDLLG
ncbi:SCY protein 2 [Spatholobus suberectus]|nr:SCY protein 2 [Spatholobus suberectus]